MKVFISWSGKSSKMIASALREWLPVVIQAIEPWMSDEDIDKGKRWRTILDNELKADVGIICLTPDNLNEPFILFEAGAIAKSVERAYACTYLYHLKPEDIGEPLNAFQHTMSTKEDTKKLIKTLNKALKEGALLDKVIDTAFENNWPDLEKILTAIPDESEGIEPKRSTEEKIDEILLSVRDLQNAQNKTLTIAEKTDENIVRTLYKTAMDRDYFNHLLSEKFASSKPKPENVIYRSTGVRRKKRKNAEGFFPDKETSK